MDFAFTQMSSKGQVVIPAKLRKHLREGEKILVIRHKDRLIMKRASGLEKNLKEDLEFARRTEEAWKSFERGEFKRMGAKEFMKELDAW